MYFGGSCGKKSLLFSVGTAIHFPRTKNFVALLEKLLYSNEKRENYCRPHRGAWLADHRETDR